MKKIFLMLALFCVMTFSLEAKEITTVDEAINIAGKQRMLTQRMLVDYAMMGMHSRFQNPEKDLRTMMDMFEENLKAIKKYTKSTAVQKEIGDVEKIWPAAKRTLSQEPTLKVCKTLCDDLDTLLVQSDDIVQMIKKESGSKSGEIVDISGKQRMLSQRIAGLYILSMWAVNNDSYQKKLDQAMAAFKVSMQTLKQYEKNNPEINTLIAEVERSYTYLEKMNSIEIDMKVMPSLVYKKLDGMLHNMDRVTHLYASL